MYTFFAHSSSKTLLQPTIATLVTFVFVDDAVALKSTCVDVVLAHWSTEESFAPVTRRGAVVFTSSTVEADGAVRTEACRVTDTAGRYERGVRHGEITAKCWSAWLTGVRTMMRVTRLSNACCKTHICRFRTTQQTLARRNRCYTHNLHISMLQVYNARYNWQ